MQKSECIMFYWDSESLQAHWDILARPYHDRSMQHCDDVTRWCKTQVITACSDCCLTFFTNTNQPYRMCIKHQGVMHIKTHKTLKSMLLSLQQACQNKCVCTGCEAIITPTGFNYVPSVRQPLYALHSAKHPESKSKDMQPHTTSCHSDFYWVFLSLITPDCPGTMPDLFSWMHRISQISHPRVTPHI